MQALIDGGEVGITASRHVDDKQAVRPFGEEEFHAGAVAYICQAARTSFDLGAAEAVVFTGTEGDGSAVLDYSCVHSLSLGIKKYGHGRFKGFVPGLGGAGAEKSQDTQCDGQSFHIKCL